MALFLLWFILFVCSFCSFVGFVCVSVGGGGCFVCLFVYCCFVLNSMLCFLLVSPWYADYCSPSMHKTNRAEKNLKHQQN